MTNTINKSKNNLKEEIIKIDKMVSTLEKKENKSFWIAFWLLVMGIILLYLLLASVSIPDEQIFDQVYGGILFFSVLISLIIFTIISTNIWDLNNYNFKGNFNLYSMFNNKEKELFKTMLETKFFEEDYIKNWYFITKTVKIEILKDKYNNLYNYIKEKYKGKKLLNMNNDPALIDSKNEIYFNDLKNEIYKDYNSNILEKYDSKYWEQKIEDIIDDIKQYKEMNSVFVSDKLKIAENKFNFLKEQEYSLKLKYNTIIS